MPEETVESSTVLPSFHKADFDYQLLLELAFRSAVLFHPECRLVLLTSNDYQPDFSLVISQKIKLFRYDIDHTEPMYNRSKAEIAFLKEYDFSSPVVFMDGDMLINANLESLFEENFDVALTYNEGKTKMDKIMPINGGLKLVNNINPQAGIAFFQKTFDICSSDKYKEYRTWWGDQYALIEAVGSDNFWQRSGDKLKLGDINIKLLSCEEYNYSPNKKPYHIWKALNDKTIIHFRGIRKKLMIPYWEIYFAMRENSTWENYLHAQRTRLWLLWQILKWVKYK